MPKVEIKKMGRPPTENPKEHFSILVPVEILADLKKRAIKLKRSANFIINEAIVSHLK